jgi:hypothetical protein
MTWLIKQAEAVGNRLCAISSRSIDSLFRSGSNRSEGPSWYLVHRVFCPAELFVVRMALTGSRQTYRKLEQLAATQIAGKRKWEK